jgi:pimeloyl-ACP methyl ester carboxylesterase
MMSATGRRANSRRNHFPNPVSDAGTQDLAANLHGDDLAALLDSLRLPNPHIVAHSSGAHAALFAGARHPDRVRSLVLVEPPATGLLAAVADGPALPRPQFTRAMAAQIRVPVLLVRGERSPDVVFGVILDELARCLPNDERVVVAAVSHTVPGENPEGIRSTVLAFLRAH